MSKIADLWAHWKVWVLSVLAGAYLGCIYRLFFDLQILKTDVNSPAWIMTIERVS